MTTLDDQWFTEISPCSGTAFSLKITKQLESVQTPYQHIEIYETAHFGHMMAIDGSIMLTSRENFLYHEVLAHAGLFSHDNPQDIIIIGGGDCGTLKEVLKHPSVQSVTQIDIDQDVTRLSKKYFPELCEKNDDPRVNLQFVDGIQWMKSAPAESADVIIIDSTDPVGPAIGLFQSEFHQACIAALRPNGLLVQQSESPLINQDILIEMRRSMRSVGFQHQVTIPFPQPVYQSGYWSVTLASPLKDLKEIRTLADPKTMDLKFYNSAFHQAAFCPQPFIAEIDEAVFAS